MKALIIGGSAGSIDTLKKILPGLPPTKNFAVVITLHVLPRGQSLLPSIFKDKCPWPLKEAESTEPVQNGVVYFAPSDYHLSIEADCTFSLSTEEPVMYSRPSIDVFFLSAAAVYKSELAAIVLSGANEDGAKGVKEILRRGGRVVAQAPETSEFPEMPSAALAVSPDVTRLNSSELVEFLNGRKMMSLVKNLRSQYPKGFVNRTPATPPPTDAYKVKCLLVDDLEENLVALRALLEGENVELFSARSGVDALELMLQHDFGLALVDVQMPSMDGFELAELMRGSERTRSTPIIFLTAGAWNRERIFKGYESGAVDFMFKPIEPRILRSKVRVFVELNRQKMAIAKGEERYALSTSAAQIGTWELNVQSGELVCSDIKLRLFGLEKKRGSISRTDIFDRIHPEDRSAFEASLSSTIDTGVPFSTTFRVILPGGHIHWLDTKAKASFDERGKVVSVFGVDMDVTAQKQASDDLLRAKQEADAANVLKSEFLANMSHEIRTPMTAILGFAELLMSEKLSEQARLDFASRIRSNGDHLLHLIDDILDLSKFEAGRVPTEKIDFAVAETITDALRSVRPLAERKGLELRFETEGQVPKLINSDPHRLRQIVLNLVGNAIKFTQTGYVRIVARYNDSTLTVDVEDTGIGLSAEQSARLFRAFQQADSSVTRKFGGTGLGLALSKRIAEALGGSLSLSGSVPNQGSVFTMRIKAPAQLSAGYLEASEIMSGRTTTPAHAVSVPEAPTKVLDGVRILLVEDSVDNEKLMRLYLEAVGAVITSASNGQEAIDKATAGEYEIVLMDVQMPGIDGLEATRRLRASGYSTPVIALTAHALPEEIEKSMAAGCDQHVTKPISRNDLIEAIKAALARADQTIRGHENRPHPSSDALNQLEIAALLELPSSHGTTSRKVKNVR